MTTTPSNDTTNTNTHRGSEYRRRWHPMKNMEPYKTIPSFAIVMLKQDDRDSFFTHNVADGQMVYRVWQCDENGQNSGEPYMFMINGPAPIPPGATGKGTQDWPALVLHDGSVDRLPNAYTCGPRADSWFIDSRGSGFICKSHDDCRAYPHTKGVHTVEVAPSLQGQKDVGCVYGGDTLAAGAAFSLAEAIIATRSFVWSSNDVGFSIKRSGIYMVAASATINAAITVAESTILRLRCYLGSSSVDHLTGHRLHSVDTVGPGDPYYGGSAYATAENVAFCGPLEVTDATPESPKVLQLRNDSGVAIVAADGLFSMWPMVFTPSSSGSLSYTSGGITSGT